MIHAFQQRVNAVMTVEHPDRVAWYTSLIYEWTGQLPQTGVVDNVAVAWVGGYCSQAGVTHAAPTYCWGMTIEEALAALADILYAQVQADISELQRTAAQWGMAVRPYIS